MKIFGVLLVCGILAALILALGNLLRCMSARAEICPGWCFVREVRCLTSECQQQSKCQAPDVGGYLLLIDSWQKEQLAKWQNK